MAALGKKAFVSAQKIYTFYTDMWKTIIPDIYSRRACDRLKRLWQTRPPWGRVVASLPTNHMPWRLESIAGNYE